MNPTPSALPNAKRNLKIEADGDTWRNRIKPKIRLIGCWLERAGFKPGHRVEVLCIAPGVIELRSADTPAAMPDCHLHSRVRLDWQRFSRFRF